MPSKAAVVFVCAVGFALGSTLCVRPAVAQMPLGTVSTPALLTVTGMPNGTCPPGLNFDSSMTCWSANVSCPNTDQIGVVYGVSPPTLPLNGTIVMLPGDGGVQLPDSFEDYIQPTGTFQGYLGNQYQVIEVIWGTWNPNPVPPATGFTGDDWEYTNTAGGSNALNILAAACRPATFLNWVRNGNSGVGGGIWAGGIAGETGTPGMCAHGNSGGAGALGYALSWYNAGAGGAPTSGGGYLDKVVMENGPVFSDIRQGCEVTDGVNGNQTYICSGTSGEGTTEPGCGPTWYTGTSAINYNLEYIDGDQSNLAEWTQSVFSLSAPSCGTTLHATTTSSQDTVEIAENSENHLKAIVGGL